MVQYSIHLPEAQLQRLRSLSSKIDTSVNRIFRMACKIYADEAANLVKCSEIIRKSRIGSFQRWRPCEHKTFSAEMASKFTRTVDLLIHNEAHASLNRLSNKEEIERFFFNAIEDGMLLLMGDTKVTDDGLRIITWQVGETQIMAEVKHTRVRVTWINDITARN